MKPVELANQEYSIVEACSYAGVQAAESYSGKLWCPFGEIFHADGGTARAFRVYSNTNSAYCFACGALYTPVRMVALTDDISDEEAAEAILERLGLTSKTWEERWAELATVTEELPDLDALAAALNTECRRLRPDWDVALMDGTVALTYAKCLGLLGKVRTEQDAVTWLRGAKLLIERVLGDVRGTRTETGSDPSPARS